MSVVGALLGFGVFAVMYAYTVVSIFIDIRKRDRYYQGLIEDDLKQLQELELNPAKFQAELDIRLSGVK